MQKAYERELQIHLCLHSAMIDHARPSVSESLASRSQSQQLGDRVSSAGVDSEPVHQLQC